MLKPELNNVDIAVCVLYLLGGAERPIDEEDVAMQCWRYVPQKFSWEKYPEHPDSEPGRLALSDAEKEKNGQLVKRYTRYERHHKKREYLLTQAGITRAKKKLKEFDKVIDGKIEVKSDRQESARFLNELERHIAFQKFQRDQNLAAVEKYEFTDFLRCSLDSGSRKTQERFELIRNRALEGKRESIVKFLDLARKYDDFADLFPKDSF